jgi:oligopeptide transport system substrate-binding protein
VSRRLIRSGFAGLCLFACAPGAAGSETILRRSLQAEPDTLDPGKGLGFVDSQVDFDLYEGLTTRDAGGNVVPGVASGWEVSADGKRWTFHLRPDAKWSNGEPLGAEDFVYTLRRDLLPSTASPGASDYEAIVGAQEIVSGRDKDLTKLGIRAVDPHTLVIDLVRPMPLLADDLSQTLGMPLYRPAMEADPKGWGRPGQLVSNGPFTLSEWTPQSQIILRRNPTFHDAAAVAIDEVRWIVAEDDATALKRYRSGELDISRVPPTELDWAKRTLNGELHTAPFFGTEYLAFNLHVEPFASNPALRKALALALDRATLNEKVNPADQPSTENLVPPGVPGYEPQSLWYHAMPMAERLEAARKLMVEAGYGPGKPLKLTVLYHTDSFIKKRLVAIAQMWREALGVDLVLANREFQVWLSEIRQHEFQVLWSDINTDLLDPQDFIGAYRSNAGESNEPGFSNAAYDQLAVAAASEGERAKRLRLMAQAERILMDEVTIIPLDNFSVHAAVRSTVSGWVDNPLNIHPSRYLGLGARIP